MQKKQDGHKVKRIVGSIPWQAYYQFVSLVHPAQAGIFNSIETWQATWPHQSNQCDARHVHLAVGLGHQTHYQTLQVVFQ